MDYLKLLEHSYDIELEVSECPPTTRIAFLSENIFNFVTYDGGKDNLFGRKSVEVCEAINNKKTFDYIENSNNYTWFLLMCNMPFFIDKLEWGTSIRGAWWGNSESYKFEINSCGLWNEDKQITDTMKFSNDDWVHFINAVIEFASVEMVSVHDQSELGV